MREYLVVANQTLAEQPLLDAIVERTAAGPCSFHLVVPATHPKHQPGWTWTERQAHDIALERLETMLDHLRDRGVVATGEVGDHSPFLAVGDALRHRRCQEIIVSTLPPGISRWLGQDLPHRLERAHHLPVVHVVAEPAYA